MVIFPPWTHVDLSGTAYAVISGAVTSGLGYVIWYKALAGLKAAERRDCSTQRPSAGCHGWILLLGEPITLRYMLASVAVLGGIALVVVTAHSPLNLAKR